jgi:hypothetical protein
MSTCHSDFLSDSIEVDVFVDLFAANLTYDLLEHPIAFDSTSRYVRPSQMDKKRSHNGREL